MWLNFIFHNIIILEVIINMDIKYVFAKNVIKYRKEMGLTQEQLSEKSGLHRTYISFIERQKRNISLTNIQKIADALEIDVWLLFKE